MLGDTDALATAAVTSELTGSFSYFLCFFKFIYLICVQLVPIQLLTGLGEGKGES